MKRVERNRNSTRPGARMRFGVLAMGLVVMSISLSACSSGTHGRRSAGALASAQPRGDLIFNAYYLGVPAADNTRSTWPSSQGRRVTRETTQYRTYLNDIQGRGFGRNQQFIRRFRSVQRGQLGR